MIPCPDCARFIRTDARHCPFCDAVVRPRSSLGPAMVGALLGLGVSACGSKGEGSSSSDLMSESTYEMPGSAYGNPDWGSEDGPPEPETTTTVGTGTETSADSTGSGSESGTGTGSGSESGTGTGTGTGTGPGTGTGTDTGGAGSTSAG